MISDAHCNTAMEAASSNEKQVSDKTPTKRLLTLMLGSIGVVYGDIGTSPLYAFREALHNASSGGVERAEILGIISLIIWALTLIVTIQYVFILLRADNRGEGGTLSLMALANRAVGRKYAIVPVLGIIGASLFYGDAIITPAISVLSAVEGLKLVTHRFDNMILPIALLILAVLFLVQKRGTAKVARFFGPITLLWFIALGIGGLIHIKDDLGIFAALNPVYGIAFLFKDPASSLICLGSVFLAVTGAEALYADLGHFGKKPIRYAWLFVVFPCLMLNYLGQGAMILAHPEALSNPFFLLYPAWALLPMVILATCATVIASQAVITGAMSLSYQAVQLGLLPRLDVRYTSESHSGQIYMPQVNFLLFVGVVVLLSFFNTSSSLANAYGIAVTGTMIVTVLLAAFVVRFDWQWSWVATFLLLSPFIFIDFAFLAANMLKVLQGGYVPLLIAAFLSLLMFTWVRGTKILYKSSQRHEVPLLELVEDLKKELPHIVEGNAVFLTSDRTTAPASLVHNLTHNKVLHEKNIILTITTRGLPRIPESEKVIVHQVSDHFWQVEIQFGFMESPNVRKALPLLKKHGISLENDETSFFLSRRSVRASAHFGMDFWQDKLYILLHRNASDASVYYNIPCSRVVEVGTQMRV